MVFSFSQNAFFLILTSGIKSIRSPANGGTGCYRVVNYQPGTVKFRSSGYHGTLLLPDNQICRIIELTVTEEVEKLRYKVEIAAL